MSILTRAIFNSSFCENAPRIAASVCHTPPSQASRQVQYFSSIFRHPFRDGVEWDAAYSQKFLARISENNQKNPGNAKTTVFVVGQFRNRSMSLPDSLYLMEQPTRAGNKVAVVSLPQAKMLRERLEEASKEHNGQLFQDVVFIVHGGENSELICGNDGPSSNLRYEDLTARDFETLAPNGTVTLLCCNQQRDAIEGWVERSGHAVIAAPANIPLSIKETIYVDGQLASYHYVTKTDPVLHKFSPDGTSELIRPPEEKMAQAFRERNFHHYMQDASEGSMDAQYQLGELFEKGIGTPPSLPNAVYWYKKAASKGHGTAKNKVSQLLQNVAFS